MEDHKPWFESKSFTGYSKISHKPGGENKFVANQGNGFYYMGCSWRGWETTQCAPHEEKIKRNPNRIQKKRNLISVCAK